MEYCEGGDLGSYIKQHKQPLPEDQVTNWFKQIVSGKDIYRNYRAIGTIFGTDNIGTCI